jgi:UDP-2-acetamido-3-amino-2,3-dideoxy-glucuronate N-acetyltransferase
MKSKKPFIALIGCGYWGKNILRNLYELGVLHTACDSDSSIISAHKEKFPDANYTTSLKAILNNPVVKAIAIATPAATHYNLIKESLQAGKDVFVEKPLALTVNEGKELVELADQKKAILMVGHILQYHPAIKKLKELISSGQIGKVQYIYSNRLNIGKLRTEENILWSFAPHDISIILSLLNEEPVGVSAFGGGYLNKGIYDVTLTALEFKNDVKGHIFVSWLHPYKEQKLIVVGSKAMVVFDDVSKEKLFLYPHKIEWQNGKIPIAQKADHQVVSFETGEPLKLELEHFIECVVKRKTPLTDKHEGLRVLKILEAAEDSMFHKKIVGIEDTLDAKPYFVHESTCIDKNVTIGKGTKIWHFSHIIEGSVVGKNCKIGQNVVIGPNASIGDGCKIQNNVSIYEGIKLEDDVFCGPSCVFTNVFNPRSHVPRMHELKNTIVGKGATIGANATIVCGNNLGEYSFIGAGAVVTQDVPPYALVYGNPAKIMAWMCKCGIKLEFKKDQAVCSKCKLKYKKTNDKVSTLQ